MKTVPLDVCGHQITLLLNGQALFDCYDRFGMDKFLTEHIEGQSKESFEAACWMLAKLGEQGELYRRWQGLERRPILSENYFRVNLSPRETITVKDAIRNAVYLAFTREETDEDEVTDIYAEELKKKRKRGASPAPTGSRS